MDTFTEEKLKEFDKKFYSIQDNVIYDKTGCVMQGLPVLKGFLVEALAQQKAAFIKQLQNELPKANFYGKKTWVEIDTVIRLFQGTEQEEDNASQIKETEEIDSDVTKSEEEAS